MLSKIKAMAFPSQNHIHCELMTGNETTEQIHVKPLTPELMLGGTCRR
jgi:hypothetical protein